MNNTPKLGFLGAPGVGKGTAMEIVKQNTEAIAEALGRADFSVYLARKFSTRPGRPGETDKVGDQEAEAVKRMLGAYQLMGKHWYGYPAGEFEQDADLILCEPSIHHLGELRKVLDGFYVVGLLKSRELREKGLRTRVGGGDNTMDEAEIARRLDEGDTQETEIREAHVRGEIDVLWDLGEDSWSSDPIHAGKLREMVLELVTQNLFIEA